ncbi:ClpP/crotonase [Meredithblackwellia eburnea MCA 4105]
MPLSLYKVRNILASYPLPNVLQLSFNRAPVNAFNDAFWEEMGEHFTTATNDPDVRVTVLTSENPKIWTAGLDLVSSAITTSGMKGTDPARTALLLRDHIRHLQNCVSAIENSSKPVIAAVHGICIGAGLDIISACDVRYSATNSLFSIREVAVGLAADVGSLQRLPSKVANDSLLRELALTARDFGTAEASELGLVSKSVQGGRDEVLKEALQLAKVIASKSPVATLGTKHLLNYSREHTVHEGLEYTATWNMAMLQADDLADSFQAFSTKKPAVYKKMGKL